MSNRRSLHPRLPKNTLNSLLKQLKRDRNARDNQSRPMAPELPPKGKRL